MPVNGSRKLGKVHFACFSAIGKIHATICANVAMRSSQLGSALRQLRFWVCCLPGILMHNCVLVKSYTVQPLLINSESGAMLV